MSGSAQDSGKLHCLAPTPSLNQHCAPNETLVLMLWLGWDVQNMMGTNDDIIHCDLLSWYVLTRCQQTMFGQNNHLSGQTFSLPVILTGYNMSDCKERYIFTPVNFKSTSSLFPLMFLLLSQVCSSYYLVNRKVKFHIYVKWQTQICTT